MVLRRLFLSLYEDSSGQLGCERKVVVQVRYNCYYINIVREGLVYIFGRGRNRELEFICLILCFLIVYNISAYGRYCYMFVIKVVRSFWFTCIKIWGGGEIRCQVTGRYVIRSLRGIVILLEIIFGFVLLVGLLFRRFGFFFLLK